MKIRLKSALWGLVLVVAIALAAGTFIANNQPFGYIAPAAINSGSFEAGTTVAYTPWFENTDYRGDLIAYPLTVDGTPLILAPLWRAGIELADQGFLTGRHIVTTDGTGTAMSFLWNSLPTAYQNELGTVEMVNFIRGDRSNEGSSPTSRVRKGVLGDIIHSNPVYVQKPISGYADTGYLTYAADNAGREARVFVGANDGMLHVFDALTGSEVYAYIPSMLVSKLTDLSVSPYSHSYYVDGPLTAADVEIDGNWHTVLVGGLGAGGIGHFALDVSSASVLSDADAMDKVLWEFHAGSTGAANLGYSYSRASIVKTNDDSWVAVLGNGYLSSSGVASLYVLDIEDGSVIREILVPDIVDNGLSSPTLIDINEDYKVDIAYAGDRNGNLWKFDLTDDDPANWSVSNGKPLFQTDDSSGKRLPITTAPEVGRHPVHGFTVFVGTGELFDLSDSLDTTEQAVYGIWDADWDADDLPISVSSLVWQSLYSRFYSGVAVRTASDNPINWDTRRGWVMPLLIDGASNLDKGERILQNLTLRDDRIQFVTINPTIATGDNWFLQLNAFTGGAPTKTILDINENNVLSIADNVDGDGNGLVEDTALDRIVGYYLGFGLASLPTIGGTSYITAAALFNHVEAVSPSELDFPDDPGLKGGHFDLDTASKIYAFDKGQTDGHVHEWDDKNDSTTIDYFNILGDNLFDIDGLEKAVPNFDAPFFLTISNSALSPAGIIEINGASLGVVEYQALQTRWLNDTMLEYETFPIYKLGPLSDEEEADGWTQLTSLKISFDAFAILKAELIGTNTGCVRGNDPGALGEYRNGALTLQAIDAEAFDGFSYDEENNVYVAANTALDGTHHFARVAPDQDDGEDESSESIFWESTVFWHWDGDCYGTDEWQEQYDACFVNETQVCWVPDDEAEDKAKKKKKNKKDKDKKDEPADPDDPDPDEDAVDSEHALESVTTADSGLIGRLFWRELIPD